MTSTPYVIKMPLFTFAILYYSFVYIELAVCAVGFVSNSVRYHRLMPPWEADVCPSSPDNGPERPQISPIRSLDRPCRFAYTQRRWLAWEMMYGDDGRQPLQILIRFWANVNITIIPFLLFPGPADG